jgi:opacity protein-like surface antigen
MKHLLTIAALVVAMSTGAYAADTNYVGADLGQSKLNGVSVGSAGLHVGHNVNPNVAIELGVMQSQDSNNAGVNANVLTTSADLVGILPVAPKVDVLGTVGVELQTLSATTTTVHHHHVTIANSDDSALGATIGAGAQYHLTDALSVRGLVKYEDVSLLDQGHDVKATVGLNVAF